MYYALYLLPYTTNTLTTIPTTFNYEPAPSMEHVKEQKPADFEQITNQKGIQINLTEAQLLEAGYQNNKKAWTEEEDALLIRLWKKKRLSWKQIAQQISGRTSKMCYSRYRRITSPLKQQWTKAQDDKIRDLLQVHGLNWPKISQFFKKRTAKQLKDHYINYLRPDINKEKWNLEDDLLLIELLKKYGKNWNLIQNRMQGRTQNQIKNRYFRRLKIMHDKKNQLQGSLGQTHS